MNRTRQTRNALLALLIGGVLAPSWAQDANKATDAEAKPKANAEEPTQVIVTANRREQQQQKVSGVVQSLAGDQLRKDGITELRQIQSAVPGLSIANQEGNVEIFIRGVGSANNTELGDPGAAPHLNGAYIPRPRGLGVMFYDVERVEVNKGPQGTLYGRNALAGTLNILTAKPRLGQSGGYVQAEVGNRSALGAEGAVNIPVGNTFALRAAGFYSDKDYGFTNVSTGAIAKPLQPAGLEENYGARLSMVWEPNDKMRVTAMGDYGRESGTGYPGANIHSAVVASGKRAEELDLRRVVYRGLQGEMENSLGGFQAKIDYDFGKFAGELTGSYRSVDYYQRNAASDSIDYPGRDLSAVNYDNFSGQFWQTKSKSKILEARLLSNDDKAKFSWATGAFYFKEDQQVGFLSLADRGYCCYSGTEFTMPDVQGESFAIYGDGTLDLTPQTRVFGGLRYTEEKKYRFGIGGNLALVLGGEDFGCCMASRFGTEGFVPNLLSRPNFNLSEVTTQAQIAQFLIDSIKTPGARDTIIQQIGSIANGSNPAGNCFVRSDIDNGWVKCPSKNPSDKNGGFSYANLTIPGQQKGSSSANYMDFRLGFEHDLSRDQLVYAKVSTGHKSGGFNDSFSEAGVPEVFSPEKVVVYEAGSRSAFELMGRRAIFNLTGFYYSYTDQVFQDLTCINFDVVEQDCNGHSLVNRNIGKSRIVGLEAETKVSLPGNFNLDLNATLLNTKVIKGQVADARGQDFGDGGNSPIINLAGNKLPLASAFNLTARLARTVPLGEGRFDWQALVNYRSAYYLSQFNEDDLVFLDGSRKTALQAGFPDKQKGYATLNLGIGYTVGALRLEAWAANVLNEQASQKAIIGSNTNVRFLNDARSFGLRARYNF